MKGSDNVGITINIVDELIKLNVDFDEQISVRDAEKAVNAYFDKLRKAWPNNSDKNILAMVAYQFARSYHQLLKQQDEALDNINMLSQRLQNNSSSAVDASN